MFVFWGAPFCISFDGICYIFLATLRAKVEPLNLPRRSGACGRRQQIAFRRRHRSKSVVSSIRRRFSIDLAMISNAFPLGVQWDFAI